jgi:hypothetical protein
LRLIRGPGSVERSGGRRRRIPVAAGDEVEDLELEERLVERAGGVAGLGAGGAGDAAPRGRPVLGDLLLQLRPA